MAKKTENFWGFLRNKILNVDFAQFYYLNDIQPAHN